VSEHRKKELAAHLFQFFDTHGYANGTPENSPEAADYTDICLDGYYDLEDLAARILEGRWSK
jgi:hypothetical protein